MPLTREFEETVQARLRSDRKYRKELLRDGVECLLAGDLDTRKAVLRAYVNATIGFVELSRRTKRPANTLTPAKYLNVTEPVGHTYPTGA